jgi:hypothetical protein
VLVAAGLPIGGRPSSRPREQKERIRWQPGTQTRDSPACTAGLRSGANSGPAGAALARRDPRAEAGSKGSLRRRSSALRSAPPGSNRGRSAYSAGEDSSACCEAFAFQKVVLILGPIDQLIKIDRGDRGMLIGDLSQRSP